MLGKCGVNADTVVGDGEDPLIRGRARTDVNAWWFVATILDRVPDLSRRNQSGQRRGCVAQRG